MEINPFLLTYCILFFVSLVAFPLWLYKLETKLNEEINNARELAKNAKTDEELYKAWSELVKVSKKCWHRTDAAKINEIKIIIETKRDII